MLDLPRHFHEQSFALQHRLFQFMAAKYYSFTTIRHRRKKHEINRQYECNICGKGYEKIQHLNVHLEQKNHGKATTKKEYLKLINRG